MIESVIPILLGVGMLLLVGIAVYKVVVKKKKVQNMYAPYDDLTRGANDVNGSRTPPVDTRQIIRQEESENSRGIA